VIVEAAQQRTTHGKGHIGRTRSYWTASESFSVVKQTKSSPDSKDSKSAKQLTPTQQPMKDHLHALANDRFESFLVFETRWSYHHSSDLHKPEK
jgi:hypothetical protein